jgi:hypothetical protein
MPNERLISVRSDVQLVPGPFLVNRSPVSRYTVRRGVLHRQFWCLLSVRALRSQQFKRLSHPIEL